MLTVSSLHVYPLKGAAGISPRSWPVDERGLRHDRRFMLVDDNGLLVSQRDDSRLALVRAEPDGDVLRIACPTGEVRVPLAPSGAKARVTVWEDEVEALLPSRDADSLLSSFLGRSCRLAWMPDDAPRLTAPKRGSPQRHVSFADRAPLLLATEAALAELNRRLLAAGADPVPLDRFRANVIVRGATADDDDHWTRIAIGAIALRASNACRRCKVVTIDQSTAEPRGPEPLRTLATYRTEGAAVTFGQHALVDEPGVISVGDEVRVLTRDERPVPI
ncbi:MAG: MOSC domain-containing protein [Phycisphaerales bacterium]